MINTGAPAKFSIKGTLNPVNVHVASVSATVLPLLAKRCGAYCRSNSLSRTSTQGVVRAYFGFLSG